MNRYQYITTIEEHGRQYVLMFDTQTGETIKSPVTESRPNPIATYTPPVHMYTPTAPISKIPPVFAPTSDAPIVAPVQSKMPPRFAEEDPQWTTPEVRQARRVPPHPTLGRDIAKIFKDPGKYGEEGADHVPAG